MANMDLFFGINLEDVHQNLLNRSCFRIFVEALLYSEKLHDFSVTIPGCHPDD